MNPAAEHDQAGPQPGPTGLGFQLLSAFMNDQLLSIALSVEQFDGGAFHWVLLESFDYSMEFEELMTSAAGFASYVEALDAGLIVLKSLSTNPTVGPRDAADDEAEAEDTDDLNF
jgi:hypothetical protein